MKINKKHIFLMLLVYALTILSIPAAFAQSGDVTDQRSLNFFAATFNNRINLQGATDVLLNSQFIMEFDKDIVDDTIWNINKNCFSLQSENNENVSINITRDFNQRQKVFIRPIQALKPGTIYYLTASPGLKAKNGNLTLGGTTAGQGITITFKTAGQAPANTQSNTTIADTSSTTSTATTDTATTDTAITDTTITDTSPNNQVSGLTKATVILNRTSTLLQSILFLLDSLGQLRMPISY
ncbi:MAG TPA: Ig-like domain-containing protein [Methylomusa anaerophila]|uniref:SbsA Ig-like domain-containing protein n=1 Tax=Methylomusa anaerophila TaxID=1930071 RepID=A0A348AIC0_9FIRM|nr:Ig-like domain-containing protein [Methylomusa anaerophila]BBB90818.1 hypothetical protein MAMMFC1_01479 [Methylomusa anaerophila]HML90525.1 Ig-like domain-containing protein [Methylomusa anaerophila]